ncbi:MAG: threonine--tRNA ligase [Bdellovibrionales bacterium RIFOXYD12_FULL_39_22]|nr:MAG: threonine--tRNA ligase [Bdellovibrionales bacterium RIFOXYB1_FULL_39_21]OFZ40850.1 MAG: threonine--tRNA ligase [Bdellovibrionales bacterium RIFOXYC12_FULL_39_17]OFZ44391.1 MAG: threonine--tRNA ligase [Bdellovibrionales bacterium RIFOXYC1_FULL_39_130]OFZ74138.1 MAG: threonine--tRNA ligase [Bdellovibrionales bacterium RIFOXYD1_FULL_39_84]OFZ91987.1 MAG: threonine--tRNA ligase [Bdellovibrionales bacterium RIFOXYD12_FULL_39_22]HLE12304.1 threonine--tRNA ligase [Bacteriovoracaceae bacterium
MSNEIKNGHDISIIRHSTAHLMAQAIARLFPDQNVQFGIGPTIENGFYYDIDMEHRLTDEDLAKIEELMKEIITQNIKVERKVLSRQQALDLFSKKQQKFKVELIKELPEREEISCYEQGEFVDLCRGPHVESTGKLRPFFKLLNTAGAYWRGNSDNQMLQRVYAVCFDSKEKLKEHLFFLEEAKKRDHRKLGKDLELFIFDKVAPGAPFFMPKGAMIYNALIDFMRRIYVKANYDEVITPQVLDTELWHTSGHYEHYKENMFFTYVENREFAMKPMNCPCHMLMFKHFKYSYRDLPLRYADFGRIHRNEKSGTLSGLTRVRTFCQDDAHIFVAIDDIESEVKKVLNEFFICYRHFNFKNIKINLSTRPPKRAGDDATWDKAETALKAVLEKSGFEYVINEGDGAFYGPKIDVEIADALNRYHQLGTAQLDFQLPERFDLKFTNKNGEIERPVVIHRALLGSLERFFGVYLEHTGGAFPFWIAPIQAVIVPIAGDKHLAFAKEVEGKLSRLNFRIKIDERNESMGLKTRQIQQNKIPFMLAIGDREIEASAVSVRKYGEKTSETISVDNLIAMFTELDKEKSPIEMRGL